MRNIISFSDQYARALASWGFRRMMRNDKSTVPLGACDRSGDGSALNRQDRPRCGARNRRGCPCAVRVEPGKKRCRFHGGLSTGPRTGKVGSGSLPPSAGGGSFFASVTSDDRDNAQSHLCPPNLIKIKQSKNAIISNIFSYFPALFRKPVNPISQMISKIRAR
jgi:hypothetical protein